MLRPFRIKLDDLSFLMIPVEGGTFYMGDETGNLRSDCLPVHRLQMDSFYLAQHLLSQQIWEKVMERGLQKGYFEGKKRPMESISWFDAQTFIQKLNTRVDYTFRLPSEAEWEYAARGGRLGLGYLYSGSYRIKEVAWYDNNSNNETQPIGLRMPNELGFYDLSGNIDEWCEDDWHSNYYHAPDNGAAWIDTNRGRGRVFRGGAWDDFSQYCRSAYRLSTLPASRGNYLGFRLALSL